MVLLIIVALLVGVSFATDACSNATTQADCTTLGSAAGGPGACIWCGGGASPFCQEPTWANEFNCPNCTTASCAPLFGCPADSTEVNCGSFCFVSGNETCPSYAGDPATQAFSVTFFGSPCSNDTSATTCVALGASQQSVVLISERGLESSSSELPFGFAAVFSSTIAPGTTAGTFSEQGTVSVLGVVLFKFAGGGQEINGLRAGQYSVTGITGIYSGLEGVMTAVSHETLLDLTVRVTVHMM